MQHERFSKRKVIYTSIGIVAILLATLWFNFDSTRSLLDVEENPGAGAQ